MSKPGEVASTTVVTPPAAASLAPGSTSSAPAHAAGWLAKSANVVELTPANFDAVVNDPSHTVVVEFFAKWCPHCKHAAPELDKFADKVASDPALKGKVVVAAIDADTFHSVASKMGIEGYPTIKLFQPASVGAAFDPKTAKYNGIAEYGPNHTKVFTFDMGKIGKVLHGPDATLPNALAKFAAQPADFAKLPPPIYLPETVVHDLLADATCKADTDAVIHRSGVVATAEDVDALLAKAGCGNIIGTDITVLRQLLQNPVTREIGRKYLEAKFAEVKAQAQAQAADKAAQALHDSLPAFLPPLKGGAAVPAKAVVVGQGMKAADFIAAANAHSEAAAKAPAAPQAPAHPAAHPAAQPAAQLAATQAPAQPATTPSTPAAQPPVAPAAQPPAAPATPAAPTQTQPAATQQPAATAQPSTTQPAAQQPAGQPAAPAKEVVPVVPIAMLDEAGNVVDDHPDGGRIAPAEFLDIADLYGAEGATEESVTREYVKAVGAPDKDVLVIYHAKWCPHCKHFLTGSYQDGATEEQQASSNYTMLVDGLQADPDGKYDNVRVVKVEMSDKLSKGIGKMEHIEGYPTLKFFKALPAPLQKSFGDKPADAKDLKGPGVEPPGRSADSLMQFIDKNARTAQAAKALDESTQAVAEGDAHHAAAAEHHDGPHAAYAFDGAAQQADEALLSADGLEGAQPEELSLYDNSAAVHPEIKAPIEGMDEAGNEFI